MRCKDGVMHPKRRAIGFEIRMINNMFMRCMEGMTYRHGEDASTVIHGWILGYLYRNQDRDIYQKDIEKECSLSRAAVTQILKVLEEKQCIRRESVEHDARLKKIIILPKGIEIHKMSFEDVKFIDKSMEKSISKEDLDTFFKVADQIKVNLTELEQEMK